MRMLLLLVILLQGCSIDPPCVPVDLDPYRYPVQIQAELKRFLSEGNKRGVYCDLSRVRRIVLVSSISYNNQPDCGLWVPDKREIYLDTTSYDYLNVKEALIFHELGHALLGRVHKNDLWYDYYPKSIMTGGRLPDYIYSHQDSRPYYINELFNPSFSDTDPDWIKNL